MGPKRLQKRPRIAPKTHPKKQRKNDAELQPRGACATWSASWWDGKRIFWKAGRTFAASELCISANSSCSCEVVYWRCLLLLLIRYYCSWLLSAVACCFLLLPIVLFTFPGFSLTSQNPSRMYDFPAISYCFLLFPIISCHFLHVMLFPAISCNRCVMLCPAVSCYFLRFPAISC
jgi:hypothetical protein